MERGGDVLEQVLAEARCRNIHVLHPLMVWGTNPQQRAWYPIRVREHARVCMCTPRLGTGSSPGADTCIFLTEGGEHSSRQRSLGEWI